MLHFNNTHFLILLSLYVLSNIIPVIYLLYYIPSSNFLVLVPHQYINVKHLIAEPYTHYNPVMGIHISVFNCMTVCSAFFWDVSH